VNPQEKMIYEYSVLNIPKLKPEREGFRHLITLVQLGKTNDLNSESKLRAEKVSNWLSKYAGDDMKFSVQEKITENFTDKEKEVLLELKKVLEIQEYETDKEMLGEFYEIFEKTGITNKEFFDISYRAIINKSKGPRLAGFIRSIGQDKIIELLNTIK